MEVRIAAVLLLLALPGCGTTSAPETEKRRAPKKPLAGSLSSIGGLAAVVLFYVAMEIWGVENEDLETLQASFFGLVILREYALFFALPVSAVGFTVGSIFGRRP